MKTLIVLLVLCVASTAGAANLINEDAKRYDVSLMCDGITSHTAIKAKSVHEDAFKEGCVITLTVNKQKRPKTLSVKNAGDIIIRKGKLVEG